MAISTPGVITRYFAAQAARDFDTLVTLFADDGIVVDEGQTRHGTTEIRAWRENVASVYEYTTEVVGLKAEGQGHYVARVRLEGNFPGGTVDLRYRFTLAHELAHLVMHRIPSDSDDQEEEANRFASELLMPEEDIKATLLPLNVDRLARLKLRWRVSMQAILYHAKSMSVITERKFRYYFMTLGGLGYREVEPHDNDIPKEVPSLLRELIDMHLQDLSTTVGQLAKELKIAEEDLGAWLLGRPPLRVL